MKKYVSDLTVAAVERPREDYVLLRLTDDRPLPTMLPGQFVEVKVEKSPATLLRRPISIHFVDEARNEMWLLIHCIGAGTRALAELNAGDRLNCVFPLGNGFTVPQEGGRKWLLVGGGVGIAPLLELGKAVRAAASEPIFLLGARTAADLVRPDLFARYGTVHITTEDGSAGCKGRVTDHDILTTDAFDGLAVCGPLPMMKAVARWAHGRGIPCEVSLENLMACGIGACLCCVEKTVEGNVCVCTEGPVFDSRKLCWT